MRTIKITLLLAAAFAIMLGLIFLPSKLIFSGADSYSFYVGDSSKNCKVVTVTDNAILTKLTLKDVCGESATYSNLDVDAFIEEVGATVIFTETLSDSVNYYCSAPLPYSVTLYGEVINLHICVKADSVTVASPIIFGGY
jgi:hypothetical protein